MTSPDPTPARAAPLAAAHRGTAILVLGFASGLPLFLSSVTLQAWLTMAGVDLARIGFLSLLGLPYTFKFLWAPLMDRIDLPLLGRRRGWIVATQSALALALFALADVSPVDALPAFAAIGMLVAFLSASQDVVVDAYRTDLLPSAERGIGASLAVSGYRLAMVLSGGVALIWTDPVNGDGMSWPAVYRVMAGLMGAAALFSAIALPRLAQPAARLRDPDRPPVGRDVRGVLAVFAAVAVGVWLTQHVLGGLAGWLLSPWGGDSAPRGSLTAKWVDLATLLLGVLVTLPLIALAARRARFETLLSGLQAFFSRPQAWSFIGFIVLYKLTDVVALALQTPFLLKGVGFSPAEVGLVNKFFGLGLTIAGALLGGALMLRLRLARALLVFGLFQMLCNGGFWWLAVHGKGALPGWTMPAMDLVVMHLAQPTPIDGGLLMAVSLQNLSNGMGTAALFALLMALTNRSFSATQYALLSACATLGPVWVGPVAGVLVEAIGWPSFFVVAIAAGLPSLLWLPFLWRSMQSLDDR